MLKKKKNTRAHFLLMSFCVLHWKSWRRKHAGEPDSKPETMAAHGEEKNKEQKRNMNTNTQRYLHPGQSS